MKKTVFLRNSGIFLLLILFINSISAELEATKPEQTPETSYSDQQPKQESNPLPTEKSSAQDQPDSSRSQIRRRRDQPYRDSDSDESYKDYKSSSRSGNRYKSRDMDRYDDNDGNERTGYYGIDPRQYGQDRADFGIIRDKQPSMLNSMNIWISSAEDWEEKGKYRGKGYNRNGKKKYDKDYKSKDDDYKKDGYHKKKSYSKVSFPVQHFPDYRKFPMSRFPKLLSIFPWLPIFYDRITYQTIIFSPTGGLYIMPPLINFYGERFAVAQLIKWGYASLVSTGAPPPPNINIAPLVQPAPPVVGPTAEPVPTYNPKKNYFDGGVKTDFPNFKPRYANTYRENSPPDSKQSYEKTYGGTNQQVLYPQGEPKNGGVGN